MNEKIGQRRLTLLFEAVQLSTSRIVRTIPGTKIYQTIERRFHFCESCDSGSKKFLSCIEYRDSIIFFEYIEASRNCID